MKQTRVDIEEVRFFAGDIKMPDTTKSGPMSEEDLRLHRYDLVKRLDLLQLGLDGLNCRGFSGIAPGFARQEHSFVYLMANTTEQSLHRHAGALDSFDGFIVIPNSLRNSAAGRFLRERFRERIHVYDEMMWSQISRLLTPYLESVKALVESLADDHYVSPSLPDLGTDRDVVEYLADFCAGAVEDRDSIVVIEANPGVGKTALATMVARRLLPVVNQAKVVPVFLPADRWRNLTPESLVDVLRSMQFPLADDEDAFSRLLQQGYIALIFDGFDELRDDSQTPKQRFEWLRNIAGASNARIIVTVRSSFWDREVTGGGGENVVDSVRIRTFNRRDRLAYWRKRLGDDAEVQAAASMHGRYVNSASEQIELFQLPNCASMIADCIERSRREEGHSRPVDISFEQANESDSLVENFFWEVMERERVRQGLSSTTAEMLAAFQEIAILYRDDEPFEEVDLEFFGIARDDLKLLRDHALLRHKDEKFLFRYALVPQRFRAARFVSAIVRGEFVDGLPTDFKGMVDTEANGSGELPRLVAGFLLDEDTREMSKVHQSAEYPRLKSLIFHALSAYVTRHWAGESRAERWRHLIRLLGGTRKEVAGLSVEGTVEGYNIRDFVIRSSTFRNLVLNCDVERMRFEDCHFDGTLSRPPKGCRLKNCKGTGEAKIVVAGRDTGTTLEHEDLRRFLHTSVSRFVARGGGYKAVRENEWGTGQVQDIDSTFGILEELVRHGVVQRHESGGRAKMTLTSEGQRWVGRYLSQGQLQGGLHNVFVTMTSRAGQARMLSVSQR